MDCKELAWVHWSPQRSRRKGKGIPSKMPLIYQGLGHTVQKSAQIHHTYSRMYLCTYIYVYDMYNVYVYIVY